MLHNFYFAGGGFAAGVVVCWFFRARVVEDVKTEINALRTDVEGWLKKI